ncbi:MAG: hypothetical protein ACT6UU_24795, partial [Hydrogenophaga sp.]|uniref:hypothetical protein n=1 Tax=Hydrogenophaga sp. TaxID=1904254 RepID=UPI004035D112
CKLMCPGQKPIMAYGAGTWTPGRRGTPSAPTSRFLRHCMREFEVVLVDEFRTSAVSASDCSRSTSEEEWDRWLRPVRSDATQKQVRGLMGCCSTLDG